MGSSTQMGRGITGVAKYGLACSIVNGKLYTKRPHARKT